jgi:hypothetical protein
MSEVLSQNHNEKVEATYRTFLRREVASMLSEGLRKKIGTTTVDNAASHTDTILAFDLLYEFYQRLLENKKVRFTAFQFKLEDEFIVRRAFLAEGIKHF